MIGDLIVLTLLAVIWFRMLKLKKENTREFLFEITLYFFAFLISIALYKLSFYFFSLFFQVDLFPSIIGIFSLSFIVIYSAIRISIFYLSKKRRFSQSLKEMITDKFVRFYDYVFTSVQDFEKAVMIFALINFVIIFTLFNSFFDAFTHQKNLNYKNNLEIDKKAGEIIASLAGNPGAQKNVSDTLYFLRAVDPRSYEKITGNTDKFVFSQKNMQPVLAIAHVSEGYIEVDPVFSKPFNSIEDNIYFASVLIHESEHLKNFRKDEGFAINILNYGILSAKCNPVTNYEYFSNIFRAVFMYGDEWCAQISEVRFLRQFNVDYAENFMKYFEDN